MAADGDGDKRHVWGPRPVGALLPPLVRPALRTRSALGAQLLADWPAIVGPALCAVTQPRRLTGGTLTLACSGPIAMELQHMSGELIARVNGHLGRAAVERLRFVQDALAAPQAAPVAQPPGPPPAAVPGLPAGPLNDALARLGAAVGRVGRRRG